MQSDQGPGRMGRSVAGWLERRFNLTELFSFLTHFGLFPAELDTRRPLREALREALSRPLPSYARWPQVLGIVAFLLFVFLGATGVMLAFYYQPTPEAAYGSVTVIVRDVSLGWFVHQVHGWAAQAFLLVLLLRLARFYVQGLYRAPREAIWILAVVTFLAGTHAALTGSLLGWSAGGYWATVRALEILYSLPLLGGLFRYIAGGSDLDGVTLVRFYFLHVAVLPALLLVFFFLHFSGVRRIGLSAGPAGGGPSGSASLQVYLSNLLILVVLVLGVLVTLATLAPAPFARPADPFSTPPGARPPWYLLGVHGFLEGLPSIVPRAARGLIVEAALAALILLPFLDRSASRGQAAGRSPGRGALVVGAAAVAAWLFFTWYAWRLEAGG